MVRDSVGGVMISKIGFTRQTFLLQIGLIFVVVAVASPRRVAVERHRLPPTG
jgi:hypothetical protein